jgi:hypothetical protein
MIKLKLVRDTFTDNTTIGKLYVNGEYFCETLEDKDRGLHQDLPTEENTRLKVYGETCIPYGKYKVIVTPSVRLKRTLPLLVNVEGFQGIRIHKGNSKKDTLGCIILGTTRGVDAVYQSTIQEERIVKLLKDEKEIEIEIVKA